MGSDGPVPVIPLQYAEPAADGRPRWRAVGRIGAAAGWLSCVVALGVITRKVESVLISGPLIALIGSLMILSGGLTRDLRVAVLGAAHCAVCVLFVVLVNLRNWDPDDARLPFVGIGTVYTAATALPTFIAVFGRRGVVAQNERA
jgi:hypothetical protein